MSAWLWVRADLRRRAASLVVLALVVGLGGGVAIAAVAGARRTTTSWDRLRAAEGPADAFIFAQLFDGPVTPEELATVRSIPGAKVAGSNIVVLMPGLMGLERSGDAGLVVASDEESLHLAVRARHLEGRLPSPRHPDEVAVNEAIAQQLDLDVGDHVTLRTAGLDVLEACTESPRCELEEAPPLEARVSGIVRQSGDLDSDAFNKYLAYAGPGMAGLLTEQHPQLVFVADVFLDPTTSPERFVDELQARLPERFGSEIADPASASVHQALRVEAQSLLALALIAAVAGLAAGVLGFARHLAAGSDDHRTLEALGVTRRERTAALLCGGLVAILGGVLFACLVAVAGSVVLPVGLARRAEPDPGFDVDGAALTLGALVMALTLLAPFAWLAWRRAGSALARLPDRTMRPVAPLPLAPALGVGLALPGSRRRGLTTGALVSVVVAVAMGVGATVLTSSNADLQADARLYGQPWEASISVAPEAEEDFAEALSAREELSAVAVARGGEVQLAVGDDQPVPAVGFDRIRGDMPLVVLDGREPRAPDEVAVGSALLDREHLGVGDTVETGAGDPLRIVGRAIVPIVGGDFPDDSLLLTLDGFDAHASRDVEGEAPESVVTFRAAPGEDVDDLLAGRLGDAALLLGAKAREPSDVDNLKGIGGLPLAVGALTAALAGLALAHALLVSERRTRTELATLRALGMAKRDPGVVLLAAGAAIAVLGVVIGVPLGIVVGRTLWGVIAASVVVADHPVVGWADISIAIAVTAGVTAVAASTPSRRARRMRLGAVLREQ
ncbi:MAG: FtsX-like permease family protein [Acidimicrobiales bacterium]